MNELANEGVLGVYLLPLKLQLIAGKRGFQREFQRKMFGQSSFAGEWVNFVEGQRGKCCKDTTPKASPRICGRSRSGNFTPTILAKQENFTSEA